MKTIGVDLWGDQLRGRGVNHPTCFAKAPRAPISTPRELFVEAYPRFAAACRAVDEPGLAVVAVDEVTGRAAGILRLAGRVGRHVAAIVGRHDRCDLFLDASDALALRHLAVVVDPLASWPGADLGYRILDLRTHSGFADEHGRALRGVRCEGPAVLRCAGHVLFALPLGDPTDWPVGAADAWACLPERVYFDEVDLLARGSFDQLPRVNADRHSHITITRGVQDSSHSLVAAGDEVGALEVSGRYCRGTIHVGRAALRDGVLLGRYARCDGTLADDPALSRVHALLVGIGDSVLLVDAASTNGTSPVDGHRQRLIEIESDAEVLLGTSTRVRWRWLS